MVVFSYDTETTGLDCHRGGRMFSFSTCDEEGTSEVYRIDGAKVRQARGMNALCRFWADPKSSTKVMHNSKFDLLMTEKCLGRKLAEEHSFHDTYVQSNLVRSDAGAHRLKDLAWTLAGFPRDDETAVKKYIRTDEDNYQGVPEHLMDRYQHADAQRTMLLHLFFWPKIRSNPKLLEVYETELDLIRVTMRMEQRGIMIHRGRCRQTIQSLEVKTRQVEEEFAAIAERETGERFSPSQTKKVSHLLFRHLGMPIIKEGKDYPSTDKDVVLLPLRELHPHPVIDLILKHRSWSHGITMLQSYLDFCDQDGVIHPNINTLGANSTGRESSSRPNLQNVEKTGDLKNPFPTPARLCFRPRPGFVNFHIDYAGQELRLLVHESGDRRMIEEIRREGGDPHALAATVFYPPFTEEEAREYHYVDSIIQRGFSQFPKESKEWKSLRGTAKNCNFAIPYGASARKAGVTLGIPFELAQRRFSVYHKMFAGLVALSSRIRQEVTRNGYVETPFGRRLYVPVNKPYMGTNYLIQSTGADIIKRAQVRVAKVLSEMTDGEWNLLLPIHDELIIECPRTRLRDAQDVLREIRKQMIDFPMLRVPMEVEVKVATVSWADKRSFPLVA